MDRNRRTLRGLLLVVLAIGLVLVPVRPASADSWTCPVCSETFHFDSRDSAHKSSWTQNHLNAHGGSSGSTDSDASSMSYEERIEWAGNIAYPLRIILGPIVVFVMLPLGTLIGVLTLNMEYLAFLYEYCVVLLEPYWILPYLFIQGLVNYTMMDLFELDEGAYRTKVSTTVSEAASRQSAAQADFVRWVPESEESRRRRVAERLTEARRQADAEARTSQLRSIWRGVAETQAKLDAPEARARLLGPELDPAAEDAVRTIRKGDLRKSGTDDALFGAYNVLTTAFGPAGEVAKHAGHALVGAIDTERELALLEMSRLEGRAARLKSLHRILASCDELPPDERKAAINKVLAEAAPLLERAGADAGMTGWSFLGKANARRANWEVEMPALRKRIQAYAAGALAGKAIGGVGKRLPHYKDLPGLKNAVDAGAGAGGRQFFEAAGKETAEEVIGYGAGKGISAAQDWIDGVAEGAGGAGP